VRLRLREGDRWVDRDRIGSGTVQVPGLEVELKLDEIYADPWGQGEG
jgi:hypothetical protein